MIEVIVSVGNGEGNVTIWRVSLRWRTDRDGRWGRIDCYGRGARVRTRLCCGERKGLPRRVVVATVGHQAGISQTDSCVAATECTAGDDRAIAQQVHGGGAERILRRQAGNVEGRRRIVRQVVTLTRAAVAPILKVRRARRRHDRGDAVPRQNDIEQTVPVLIVARDVHRRGQAVRRRDGSIERDAKGGACIGQQGARRSTGIDGEIGAIRSILANAVDL